MLLLVFSQKLLLFLKIFKNAVKRHLNSLTKKYSLVKASFKNNSYFGSVFLLSFNKK